MVGFLYDIRSLGDDNRDLAEALGNMVIAWASAESVLIQVFSEVAAMDIDMAHIAYYRIPTFEARTKVLAAIIPEWYGVPSGHKDGLLEALEKLRGLSKARNDWIHGLWTIGKPGSGIYVLDFRAHRDSPGRRKPVKAADVENHNEAVLTRANDVVHVLDASIMARNMAATARPSGVPSDAVSG